MPKNDTPPVLLTDTGKNANMEEVMRWWMYHYPRDVFVDGPLAAIYDSMEALLTGRVRYSQSRAEGEK